jgi:hypothetical protein
MVATRCLAPSLAWPAQQRQPWLHQREWGACPVHAKAEQSFRFRQLAFGRIQASPSYGIGKVRA